MSEGRDRSRRSMAAALGLVLTGFLSGFQVVTADGPPQALRACFGPPTEFRGDLGAYRSPLVFADGRDVRSAADWTDRRREIREAWHNLMGPWPPLLDGARLEPGDAVPRDGFTEQKARLRVAPDRVTDGYLLVPDGQGPFPAVLVVYYEPETAVGRGNPMLGFADRLVRRGFVTLSIGFDPRTIDPAVSDPRVQPLSYLAYVADNAHTALAAFPKVDPKRVGVMGHSDGGKWALFAACLDDRVACGVWSDPGAVFDESRPNVNYWDPWYLGSESGRTRKKGLPSPNNPAIGAYARLRAGGHDLHELQALMAPRPFLLSGGSEDPPERWRALNHVVAVNALLGKTDRVAMTSRPGHTPTPESNEQAYQFLEHVLKPTKAP